MIIAWRHVSKLGIRGHERMDFTCPGDLCAATHLRDHEGTSGSRVRNEMEFVKRVGDRFE